MTASPEHTIKTHTAHGTSHVGLLTVIFLFLCAILPLMTVAPAWDSASFYICITNATGTHFHLHNFRCANHASVLYFLLLGITQYIDYGNVRLVYFINILIAIGGAVGMYGILQRRNDQLRETERGLLAALFLAAPVFFAHVIHINLDMAMTCFFVIFLSFLLHRRWWLAGFFAGMMVFTKETGMALYAATIVLFSIIVLPPFLRSQKWHRTLGQITPLLIPGLGIALYFLWLRLEGWSVLWNATEKPMMINPFLIPINDRIFRLYLGNIFIVNFQWIITTVIAIALIIGTIRWRRNRSSVMGKPATASANRERLFLIFVAIATVYITTLVRPWSMARYVLAAYPVLLIVFSFALTSLWRNWIVRSLILSVILIAFVMSNLRTIDPVSKAFYGTFPFGTHAILQIDARPVAESFKRDEMIYNLEYIEIEHLYSDAMAALRPSPTTPVVMGESGAFYFPPLIDAVTYRPTTVWNRSMKRRIVGGSWELRSLLQSKEQPPLIHLIAFPNLDNSKVLTLLKDRYRETDQRVFAHDGYSITTSTFMLSDKKNSN